MHASVLTEAPKPGHLFDRDAEWRGLVSFAADARPGATLGVVSGRRRQGKSYLLQALTAVAGGIYFPALEVTEAVSLRLFADELIRFTGAPVRPFRDWLEAIPCLFQLAADRPCPGDHRRVSLPGEGLTRPPFSYPARARARRDRVREPGAAAAVRLRYVGHGWPAFRAGAAAGAGRA